MDTGAGAQSGGFRVLIGRENHLIGAPGSFSGTLDSAKLWQTADHAMMDSTLDQSRKAAKVGAALRRGWEMVRATEPEPDQPCRSAFAGGIACNQRCEWLRRDDSEAGHLRVDAGSLISPSNSSYDGAWMQQNAMFLWQR